jgi:FKBP-type peptidyl-prolyl cis-trans isomerase FkpA
MSVSQVPLRPVAKGTLAKLWLAVAALAALAYGIAYYGVNQFTVGVETVAAGAGPLIGEMDGVVIEYTGRTSDGAVFDSTEAHGGPASMLVGSVIPGFKKGLMQMQQGGSYKLHIPRRLAYGDNPPPGAPVGDLDFDVHVKQVVPNAALMLGSAPQGQ